MTTKRRGRPPSDGQRKSSAEYQRAYRQRKKQAPVEDKVAYFKLTGKKVDRLDAIASYFELSRAKVVNDLFGAILNWIMPEYEKAEREIEAQLKKLPEPPTPEELTKLKVLKVAYWEKVTLSINKDEHNETSSVSD